MSKRKEKSDSDIQDESPPTKLLKSDVIAGRRSKKHGMKKSKSSDHSDGSSASSGGRNDVTTVSSNWIALSKSLGISTERKQSHSGGADDERTTWKRRKTEVKNGESGEESDSGVKENDMMWFDDIPVEDINREMKMSTTTEPKTVSLVTGNDKSVGRYVGLDCEMVGTGADGSYSMLARICLVNHHGNVLLDTFVAPMDRVTDYRTSISGVTPRDLRGAPQFSVVQKQVSDLLKERVLIGHSVQNDLKALLLSHPKKDTRDTLKYTPFKKIVKSRTPSLKKLAKEILGIDIQDKEHSPVEDARAAMRLYQLHKKDWETSVRDRLSKREIRERKRERRRLRREEGGGGEGGGGKKTGPRTAKTTDSSQFNVMLFTER